MEARGIALTPTGRDLYDRLTAQLDEQTAGRPDADRPAAAAALWSAAVPRTERKLCVGRLAHFTYSVASVRPPGPPPPTTLHDLVTDGWVDIHPIVYEDFLPRCGAGIFASNLSGAGRTDTGEGVAVRDAEWLSDVIGRRLERPDALYRAESQASLRAVCAELGVTIEDRV